MRTELLSSLRRRRRSGWLAVAALAVTTVAAATVPVGSALGAVPAQSNGTSDGIMCEPNPNGQNAFSLDATSGYVTTPDGNSVYMWSYTGSGRAFQLPGPTLCVTAGTKVTVTLKNTLPEPVSILWPGQDDVAVGGQPAAPEFDGSGNLSSLTNSAAASTGTVTYSFTAGKPGTYLYSSGTDVTKQREMGLYGSARGPPGRSRQLGERRRDERVRPDHGIPLHAVADRPRLPQRRREEPRLQREHQHGALLLHQRPEHAGHAGAEQRVVDALAAVRRARAHPGERGQAGAHPLRRRGTGRLRLPPARQQPARHQPRRQPGEGRRRIRRQHS